MEYRLYFMDRFDGHIERRHDFHADDDQAAIRHVATLRNGQPMELWQQDRKIRRWESAPRSL